MTPTTPSAEALAALDRDAAIRIWHKHCDKFASRLGDAPPSPVIDAMIEFAALSAEPKAQAQAAEPVPWLLYLSDRADGLKGRYAIARWNPAGYREVWNLHRHCWSAFSDEALTFEQALQLLQAVVIPTADKGAP